MFLECTESAAFRGNPNAFLYLQTSRLDPLVQTRRCQACLATATLGPKQFRRLDGRRPRRVTQRTACGSSSSTPTAIARSFDGFRAGGSGVGGLSGRQPRMHILRKLTRCSVFRVESSPRWRSPNVSVPGSVTEVRSSWDALPGKQKERTTKSRETSSAAAARRALRRRKAALTGSIRSMTLFNHVWDSFETRWPLATRATQCRQPVQKSELVPAVFVHKTTSPKCWPQRRKPSADVSVSS